MRRYLGTTFAGKFAVHPRSKVDLLTRGGYWTFTMGSLRLPTTRRSPRDRRRCDVASLTLTTQNFSSVRVSPV